jgi:phage host-nuclease inhibitor protein Gam
MAKQLKAKQEIETVEQLEQAIQRIGELDSAAKIVQGELDQEISQIRTKYADRLVLKPGKTPLTVEGLRASLHAKAERYCTANKAGLLTGGVKYKQLTHGRIGWRKQPDTFNCTAAEVEGSPTYSILETATKAITSLVNAIATVMWGCPIATFLDVRVTWNKKAIKEAITSKTVEASVAKQAGFEIVIGSDVFYCEPKTD